MRLERDEDDEKDDDPFLLFLRQRGFEHRKTFENEMKFLESVRALG